MPVGDTVNASTKTRRRYATLARYPPAKALCCIRKEVLPGADVHHTAHRLQVVAVVQVHNTSL
jgi:hypothetical protein